MPVAIVMGSTPKVAILRGVTLHFIGHLLDTSAQQLSN